MMRRWQWISARVRRLTTVPHFSVFSAMSLPESAGESGNTGSPVSEPNLPQTFEYRGYKIVVTQAPPFWEGAIHPSHPSLPKVDWTYAPIRGHNEKVVEGEAQRRINEALGVTLE